MCKRSLKGYAMVSVWPVLHFCVFGSANDNIIIVSVSFTAISLSHREKMWPLEIRRLDCGGAFHSRLLTLRRRPTLGFAKAFCLCSGFMSNDNGGFLFICPWNLQVLPRKTERFSCNGFDPIFLLSFCTNVKSGCPSPGQRCAEGPLGTRWDSQRVPLLVRNDSMDWIWLDVFMFRILIPYTVTGAGSRPMKLLHLSSLHPFETFFAFLATHWPRHLHCVVGRSHGFLGLALQFLYRILRRDLLWLLFFFGSVTLVISSVASSFCASKYSPIARIMLIVYWSVTSLTSLSWRERSIS